MGITEIIVTRIFSCRAMVRNSKDEALGCEVMNYAGSFFVVLIIGLYDPASSFAVASLKQADVLQAVDS